MSWYDSLLNTLFPPHCVGCHRRGEWFCDRCYNGIKLAYEKIRHCSRCDQPLLGHLPCTYCPYLNNALSGCRITGEYTSVLQKAIWMLKFHGKRILSLPLGRLLAQTWQYRGPVPIQAIVAVPMSLNPHRRHHFNHADLIAHVCAPILDIPYLPDAVIRTRAAPPQHKLGSHARRINVSNLFACNPAYYSQISGKAILIIDDVITTGATLGSIANALQHAGSSSVWGLALAHPTNLTNIVTYTN
jgi:competence protein ComFC